MKSRLNKIVAIILGVVILISSNGLVLASHSCFSKSETDVSLFSHKGCCSNKMKNCHSLPAQENAFTKKCCELRISFHQVDVSSFMEKVNSHQLDCFPRNLAIHKFFVSKGYNETLFPAKAPPNPGGRILLTNISLLQI